MNRVMLFLVNTVLPWSYIVMSLAANRNDAPLEENLFLILAVVMMVCAVEIFSVLFQENHEELKFDTDDSPDVNWYLREHRGGCIKWYDSDM